MKQKNSKRTNKKNISINVFLGVILTTILVLLFSFLVLLFFSKNKNISYNIKDDTQEIIITTDKEHYSIGENIELYVKNRSTNSIYFEPCEYLDRFEKKIDGEWKESSNYRGENIYDESGFKREDNITNCEIQLPKDGVGIYRAVVQIYYECKSPGKNMCANSKIFYSNSFEIKNDDSFCEDKVLENCDGKRVSIIGTFITSKAHFLSNIENRIVEHQWAGGILIHGHGEMEEGKKYNVVGVIRKGGYRCGTNNENEQCMLDEKGMILPYPTKIEVEKNYPVK
ncbi:MAG: hypothetical protein KAI71_01155 [Candidatus Pacebacteria bacterium]|nr:hypothetical protein [Candidatus Paceibacterota bacterium]